MINAVVFDLDGTLLDTIPDIAAALNRALISCGLPTHTTREYEQFVGGGIREAVLKAAPVGTEEDMIDRILRAYRTDYSVHCAVETTYYTGVMDMLEGLVQAGLALGVLSNKTESSAQKVIETYFPSIPFRFVLGRVDGRPLKPDRGAAEPVLEVLSLPAGEIAYVGDSGTDMLFAKAAGMIPVAAPWGYRSREQLVEMGAVIVPECPAELLKMLLEGR